MSFTSSRASSSSPVGDLDRNVKVDFRDETNSKSQLVESGRVRFRLTRAEGGSEFVVDLTSPSMSHTDVFSTHITEEKFSQPPYNQLGVKFHELPGFIHTMLKSAMSKDPQHFLAVTIRKEEPSRKDEESRTVAKFSFSTKHTVGTTDVRAHLMTLHLNQLDKDHSFRYWVGRAKTAEKKYADRKEMGSKSERQFCSLQVQYNEQADALKRMTRMRDDLQDKLTQHLVNLAAMEQVKDDVENECCRRNEQIAERERGIAERDDMIVSLEKKLDHLTTNYHVLLQDWKRLKEKEKAGALDDDVLDELKEAHEQTKAERNQWKQKYAQLKAQFQKQEAERTETGLSKVEALERENQALKERLAKLKQESEEWKLLAADQTADRTAASTTAAPNRPPSSAAQPSPSASRQLPPSKSGQRLLQRRPTANPSWLPR